MTGKKMDISIVLIALFLLMSGLHLVADPVCKSENGELLYNGIQLPAKWPPAHTVTYEPMPVPYLKNPPEVIPIDVGRQLFVDDFLIEQTTLLRAYHPAEQYSDNPVLKADKPWEMEGGTAMATVFSDGVWYDPQDKLFKMWYVGGRFPDYEQTSTCYATSKDGMHWLKPKLDIEPGTNILFRKKRDSSTVWLDLLEEHPQKRFKMFLVAYQPEWRQTLRFSPDGIHWSEPLVLSLGIGDRTTTFYNPFRKVWVTSIRAALLNKRARKYWEHTDPAETWKEDQIVEWVGADCFDPHNPNPEYRDFDPQLYNLDAVAYESLMLGLFSIHQGPENNICSQRGIQKRNEILLGFSRDGFHWYRPYRLPFIASSEAPGAWNWGNIQSAGGGCLIVRDKLYFYFSGRALADDVWHGCASTGLAFLRRDGFASMYAGRKEGNLTTRPLKFSGKYMFVNVDTDQGELAIEVLDKNGNVIPSFAREKCAHISVDKTLQAVSWQDVNDLSAWAGKPVRFRFYLRNGSLYSLWVSPDPSGASFGYVAAGGPRFTGPRDTLGTAAYKTTE